LTDAMAARPEMLVFGEDVGRKGGVYGLTRGLAQRFGPARVFDTLLDEQSILGFGLGLGVSGMLPVPEIQYLAYLHNAEDQLRGEAASLRFFSAGAYTNPMVVRVAGLAYQKGFGGHFHNDNAVAVPRNDIRLAAARTGRVLVVDETRHSGGVGEGVLAMLVDSGYRGRLARVASRDSFVPLGAAANLVLLGEDEIEAAARDLAQH